MKLTPWFVNGEKPARDGLYEVRSVIGQHPVFSYWDGKRWGWICPTKGEAEKRRRERTYRQDCEWRGLAEEPKQ